MNKSDHLRNLASVFLLLCSCSFASAAGTVTTTNDSDLRAAMAGGGTVTFAVDGTITLTNPLIVSGFPVVLDAAGHQVTISGQNAVQLFQVNTNLTLLNLTLAYGYSTNGGAAINITAGTVSLTGCIVATNISIGSAQTAGSPATEIQGGAVFNSGVLHASNTVFSGNQAQGGVGLDGGYASGAPGGPGARSRGGAIFNQGQITLDGCTFNGNQTTGGGGGVGGTGVNVVSGGGGLGGDGGAGATGQGGAVWNHGSMICSASTFFGNQCTGGPGGNGGAEGFNFHGPMPIPGPPGGGASGDIGAGGAVWNEGTVSCVNCTLVSNLVVGGSGGTSGDCMLRYGQTGTNSCGGAIGTINGNVTLVDCTLSANDGHGGAGGYSAYCSFEPAPAAGAVFAASLYSTNGGTFLLTNTLVAGTSTNAHCSATVTDGGHNICSDASAALTAAGSSNSTDPKLGALTTNGGPTMTCALLVGSPAIEAGISLPGVNVDQRGMARPFGSAPDIGAFEAGAFAPPPPTPIFIMAPLIIPKGTSPVCWLRVDGPTGTVVHFQRSFDLSNWTAFASNSLGVAGFATNQDYLNTGKCFYRTVSP